MAAELCGDVTLEIPQGVIHTKVEAPVSRRLVPREQLFEALNARPEANFTLICAPAGWGKSSLLAAWSVVDERNRPFAWFAVDATDNDPVKFWTYVIEALRTVEASIGAGSLALLRAPGIDLVEHVIPQLVNEITALCRPVVLAVDDYHLVDQPEIHRSLEFLVEHMPDVLHVAIATRVEPHLPIARLRARGKLVEIDAACLRFSDEEAERFLNEFLDLDLTRDDIRTLSERTDGWAAGLYLAALSLRDRNDRHEAITQFAGDHHHIVDYLWAEVLAGQDDEVCRFLRQTSILERLCSPLCEAVTGAARSGQRLREIERSNLFLLPLDTRREWYRYHHLFRDLLRRELAAVEPDQVPDLHRRAARWLLEAGHVSEAIHHTIMAGDLDRACELIATHWIHFIIVGDHGTVASWLEMLSDDALMRDARVCVAGAFVSLSTGQLQDTEAWLEKAQRAGVPGPFRDGSGSVAAATAFLRMSHRLGIGALDEARAFGLEAVDLLEEISPLRPVAFAAVGFASYLMGRHQEGIAALEEGARQMGIGAVGSGPAVTVGWLAGVRADLGQWDEADELATRGLTISAEMGGDEYWVVGFSHFARGRILERWGELKDAEASLSRGIQLLRRGLPIFLAYVLPDYARFKYSRGDRHEARQLMREAHQLVDSFSEPGILPRLIDKAERRLRLAPSRHSAPFVEDLSPREHSVLRLLTTTLSQREIARELYVSMNTVKSHTKTIFRKLGVSTRSDAVSRARALELI